MHRILVICALVLSSSWLLAQGGGDRPVFRGGVDLLQLDVSVLDGKRQPVRGLSEADFTVLENGVARPIRAFTAVVLPSTLPNRPMWADAAVPDVATNDVGLQDGRLVVILMDRTIPVGQPTIAATKIAATAVAALGPHDLAALVSTSGGVPQNFTSDRERLLKAINQRDWSQNASIDADQMLAALDPTLGNDALSDGRCLCGLCVMDEVTRIADAVRGAAGRRKALFFIGSGLIVQAGLRDPKADVGCDRLTRDARTRMFAALDRSSMVVHSLDPNGVVNLGPQTRASSNLTGGQAALAAPGETNAFLANQESLGILPERTGGRRVINTNTPDEKVADIFHESDSYYVLAVERGETTASEGPRTIEVRVGRKDLHVYAQRRYAPDQVTTAVNGGPDTTSSLTDALRGLLPAAGMPLSMVAAAFAGPAGDRAAVNVTVDVVSLAGGAATDKTFDVALMALDQTGRSVASARQTSTLIVPAKAQEANVQTQLALPAGNYELRLAVRDAADGRTASVFSQLLVPSFSTAPLSLSDVVLTIPATQTSAIAPMIVGGTTTRREFGRAERVTASFQIYQALERTTGIVPAAVQIRILDGQGRIVHEQTLSLGDGDFHDRRADRDVVIPVDALTAGEYLLSIEATAGKDSAKRLVRFAVR